MKKRMLITLVMLLTFSWGHLAFAQSIPLMINFQGKVDVTQVSYSGLGLFKFALVDDPTNPTLNYWTNDGSTPAAGAEPAAYVMIPVNEGLFAVQLGDTNLANMIALDPSIFDTPTLYLRVWFSTNVTGFEQLMADAQLVSVPYAYRAEVANRVETATGTIISEDIADNYDYH